MHFLCRSIFRHNSSSIFCKQQSDLLRPAVNDPRKPEPARDSYAARVARCQASHGAVYVKNIHVVYGSLVHVSSAEFLFLINFALFRAAVAETFSGFHEIISSVSPNFVENITTFSRFSNFLECEDLFGGGWGVTLNSNIKM